MRRWILIALGTAAILTAGAIALPRLIPDAALRAATVEALRAATGAPAKVEGPVMLSLLPSPHVVAEGIRIGLDGTIASADRLEADVSLPALLVGAVRVGGVTLSGGTVFVGPTESLGERWRGIVASLADKAAPAIGPLRLVDTTIVLGASDRDGAPRLRLSGLTLRRTGAGLPIEVDGALDWRGSEVGFTVRLSSIADLAAGGRAPLGFELLAPSLRLSLDGTLANAGGLPRLDVDLDVSSGSLGDLLDWLRAPVRFAGEEGQARLRATAAIGPDGASLREARISIGGSEAEGALSVAVDAERLKVSGTLAADRIDLAPFAWAGSPETRRTAAVWSAENQDIAALSVLDADIRLSATQIDLGAARIGPAALSVVGRDGTMEISLGEAAIYGGRVTGVTRIGFEPGAIGVQTRLSFDDVDAGGALRGLFGVARLDGRASGAVTLEGRGASITAILASLSGTAKLTATDGAIIGTDLTEALRRLRQRPLSADLSGGGGRTAFSTASASFTIEDGIAHTTDLQLEGTGLGVQLSGRADLPTTRLDLSGTAALVEDKDAAPSFSLPIRIAGPWTRPDVDADADALIQRSGAAAPLLRRLLRQDGETAPAGSVP